MIALLHSEPKQNKKGNRNDRKLMMQEERKELMAYFSEDLAIETGARNASHNTSVLIPEGQEYKACKAPKFSFRRT